MDKNELARKLAAFESSLKVYWLTLTHFHRMPRNSFKKNYNACLKYSKNTKAITRWSKILGK